MAVNNQTIEYYKELGQKWLRGEVEIVDWEVNGRKITFTETQKQFINDRSRYCLACGGIASGKTLAFLIKIQMLCLFFPDNRILLGRKSRTNVEASLLPDFFDLCPPEWVTYKVGPGIIEFFNGSEIIIKGLDVLQAGSEVELKKAIADIRGLNLGGIFIDQLEEIEIKAFEALQDRMRRDVGYQQFNATMNPANHWAYDFFKENPRPNTKYLSFSTLENSKNLPEEYLRDRLAMGESYVRRFLYGEWTPELMTEASVFPNELLHEQKIWQKTPLRDQDGIKIYEEPDSRYTYQIGVDPSEGTIDPCCIQVSCVETGNQCAVYSGFVNATTIVERAVWLAQQYSIRSAPLMVIESNGGGLAVIELMKQKYDRIYERESFNYREQKSTTKLGFATTFQTKKLLIEHLISLLRKKYVKIRDEQTLKELFTFVYSNEAQKKGAGAQPGFHDDRVMALMMSLWNISPIKAQEEAVEQGVLRSKVFARRLKRKTQYE